MTEHEHHTKVEFAFAMVPEALLYDAEVDALAIRVYACLARHGMDPSSCYPSHARIGRLIGCSKRSVNRPLRVLESRGWIKRFPRHDERGDRTSDGFLVRSRLDDPNAPPALEDADPSTLEDADPPRSLARKKDTQVNETPEEREEVTTLANLLADLIEENGAKRPTITKSGFLDPIRLLLDRDEKTVDQVERAIRWCQNDEFWRSNILSGKKLREKYETLRLQAMRQGPTGRTERTKNAAQEYLERRSG